MLVRTLLAQKPQAVVTVLPSTTIADAMKLMVTHDIGCLPVVDESGKLIGLINDADVMQIIEKSNGKYKSLRVSGCMSTNPVIGLPDDDLSMLAGMMSQHKVRHIPVFDGSQVLAVLSRGDLMRAQMESHHIEQRYLQLYNEGLGMRDLSSDG